MSAPLVVNTTDKTVWTRRAVTRDGDALYAMAGVEDCPAMVMATLAELAEHGIAGTADALPVPVGLETQPSQLEQVAVLEKQREAGAAPRLIVYRASHESIPMGLYTTREAAREHCMTLMRREACGHALDWRTDEPSEEDSPEELWDLGDGPDDEWFATGYVVTPLEVASEYDEDGDE